MGSSNFLSEFKVRTRKENLHKPHYSHSNTSPRIETRRCYVSDKIDWLSQKDEWKDLKSVVMIESIREIGVKSTTENRFYITILPADAKLVANAIRSHWGIENGLHWVLNVTLREDNSRIREKIAVENIGLVRKNLRI